MNSVFDQIKERIDIVEFISAYVPLRKAGRSYVGFCPFHPNTRTPAFNVFPDTQSYHCFGCKASGTVFDFLMQREGLDLHAALAHLAQRAGVQLRQPSAEDARQDQLRTRLFEINAAAAVFFHHLLVRSRRGAAARAYVAQRGLNEATIEAFQLGYALDDWSALLEYLTNHKGFEPEEIEAAGLAIQRERGGYYDRFRDRLMFPIRNLKGDVIAFGGRSLGDGQPKYMNSPQTLLFDKGKVLYGLDRARDAIRDQNAAVIVEGYVDAIVAHQYGFRNVVAPLGTALTADHAALLKKLAKRIYLALDADPAGVRATLKGVQTLREHGDGHMVPVPTPEGVIRWERDLDAEIKIIALPDGRDPDEVIRDDPERWRALVAEAQPVMEFYLTALTIDLDLQSGKGKAEAVARLAPLVAQVANPIEQAHHIERIARLIGIESHIVRAALPSAQHKTASRLVAMAEAAADHGLTQEDFLLGWLLRYPAVCTAVQEKVRRDAAQFPLVGDLMAGTVLELFERVDNRAIWQAWSAQPDGTDVEQWLLALDDALREQAQRVLQLHLPTAQAYRYVNDALECATILQLRQARRWMVRLSHQVDEGGDDAERLAALERLVQIKTYIGTLSTPKRSSTYADLHTQRTI